MQILNKKLRFFNKNVLSSIIFLIIQQIIVASSTIWITRLIAQIQQEQFSYFLLGSYLASLFLPYFPGSIALVQMAKAKMVSTISFVNHFVNSYRGYIVEWTNSSRRSTLSSILGGEAQQTIDDYLDYTYHFFSCGLNVFLNLFVLAFIIEPWLLASYAVGLLFAFLILRFQKKMKKVLSLRAQQGRIKWVEMLLKAWDNVLLDNSYNFNIWRKKTAQRGKRLTYSSVKLQLFSQAISVGMAFVLLGPSFFLIWYLPVMHNYDFVLLAMIVVALPRTFQVLSYSYELLFVLSELPMQKSRAKTILNILELPKLTGLEETLGKLKARIQWEKIDITSPQTQMLAQALVDSLPSRGRYTIKGENGSGKSSILLLLKMLNGKEAFYLPAKHDLAFQCSQQQLSTGQLTRKMLHELVARLETPIVLLDEWDANLDLKNQRELSSWIDQLAQKKCVIEVRHR
ncbi:MAG: hypothetical protein JSR80_01865 [Verrucomicrobia bacterium]|nr:hypothetical protein [Verrucomicrobiota bacterium]